MSNKHLTVIILCFGILGAYFSKRDESLKKIINPDSSSSAPVIPDAPVLPNPPSQPIAPEKPAEKPKDPNPINLNITIPGYLELKKTWEQAKQWEKEAPDLVSVEEYGKSSQGKDLFYLKICNKNKEKLNPNIFITAAIHGNESWSSACAMAYAGNLINQYGKNERITKIINTKNIYVIPIVSPDSYPKSRIVDKVDPNRNFFSNRKNFTSILPVENLKNLFKKVKPKSVLSMHTYGRIFLFPYGETYADCANKADYLDLVGRMADVAKYKIDKACNLYTKPIHGTDVDYFYKNGAFSIVMEIGTHQVPPTLDQTKSEFERTWESILLFLEESTNFSLDSSDELNFGFLENKGISDTYLQQQISQIDSK